MYLKEIIPINLLDNFKSDGTQILEIEDVFTESGDLDDGKSDVEGGELDPFQLMNEKLELIRLLKKPQRLMLISPTPILPELPRKIKNYVTKSVSKMFSRDTKLNSLIRSKMELEKIRANVEINGTNTTRNLDTDYFKPSKDFKYTTLNVPDFKLPRNMSSSMLNFK